MFDRRMNNFHSSLAELLQSNIEDDSDVPTSLCDLINAHKPSREENEDQDVESLSEFALKRLSLNDETENATSRYITSLKSFTGFSSDDQVRNYDGESNSFSTLEEYTRSFLSTNNRSSFLSQKPLPLNSIYMMNTTEETMVSNEELPATKICDSSQKETRNIDLTTALLNSGRNTLIDLPRSLENRSQFNESVFYPVKECTIDISALADEDILCNSNELSHFGFVLSKKWNHRPLPKKYHKIGRTKPYNTKLSFKFDTPSPDDIALKARNRTISSSKD